MSDVKLIETCKCGAVLSVDTEHIYMTERQADAPHVCEHKWKIECVLCCGESK